MPKLIIKVAETEEEFNQIYKLNYQTFVEEVKQHSTNKSKTLIDKFDKQNIYFIALEENKLIGMIALKDSRPFSLDHKLSNLDTLIPKVNNIVEIRLLTIIKSRRNSTVLFKMLQYINETKILSKYELILITAIINQIKLYKHIGFESFGPQVGNETKFQPMFITKQNLSIFIKQLAHTKQTVLNLLPGPVSIAKNVKIAFEKPAISHRSKEFIDLFENTKQKLLKLSSTKYVEVFTGSGTTSNDIIAGQLSELNQKGLIISNGEFGDRLLKQAKNFNLDFETIKNKWGQVFNLKSIKEKVIKHKIKWIWFVLHETSTGMLNNYEDLHNICEDFKLKLCVDSISAFGTESIDFTNVYMASAVSSKGIASFSGLGFVFYNHDLTNVIQQLPSSINLAYFNNSKGIPFTISSNLIQALNTSLKNLNAIEKRIIIIKKCSTKLRGELINKGHQIVVNTENNSNSTLTIELHKDFNSVQTGVELRKNNIFVNFESQYLIDNNWIQISIMGETIEWNKVKLILDYL